MKNLIRKNSILIYLFPITGVGVALWYMFYHTNEFDRIERIDIHKFMLSILWFYIPIVIILICIFYIYFINYLLF